MFKIKHSFFCFLIIISSSQLIYAKETSVDNSGISSATIDESITDMNKTSPSLAAIEQEEMKFYSIEVVLFRHKDKSGLLAETWELAYNHQDEVDATMDSNSYMARYLVDEKRLQVYNPLVSQLISAQLQLNEQAGRIKYAKPYQLLAHFAWTQPGYSKNKATAVKLVFPAIKNIQANIKVELARYLHTYIDLQAVENVCRPQENTQTENLMDDDISIKVETNTQATQATQTTQENLSSEKSLSEQHVEEVAKPVFKCQSERLRFKQNRKMRSKELHYIDHPAFGLLVLITPAQAPADNPLKQTDIKKPVIKNDDNKALDGIL